MKVNATRSIGLHGEREVKNYCRVSGLRMLPAVRWESCRQSRFCRNGHEFSFIIVTLAMSIGCLRDAKGKVDMQVIVQENFLDKNINLGAIGTRMVFKDMSINSILKE